jgi:hypothetical protein
MSTIPVDLNSPINLPETAPSFDLPSNATASTVSYAARSISWDTVTLPGGGTFPGGALFPDTVLEERHDDESIITENPVEIGSVTNDHAYDLPQELELTYVWSPASKNNINKTESFLNDWYMLLLNLKQAKILVTVVTGKRQYDNMLIKGLSETTDANTENVLMIRIALRQLILAITQTVSISSAAQQSLPQKTAPTINSGNVSLGSGQNFNGG